jgi:hypothetical protein
MNYLWYSSSEERNTPDSIHQTLAFGTLSDIEMLKKTLGERKLVDTFVQYPKKVYTSSALNFVKKFILHISSPVDDQKYLKSTPRYTR